MNSELRRAINRANQARQDALASSHANLAPYMVVDYYIADWSRSVQEMYAKQWVAGDRHPDGGWDWPEIGRRYDHPKDQVLAVITGDRLAALGLVSASHERAIVRYLEGDPRNDCPLRGSRATIILDAASTYGQRLGCREIHLEPVNATLLALYRDIYGFSEVTSRRGVEYLKRGLV